ncbi:MAG: hypothetical protein K9N62_17845 [Verrucomicrobia bacterium]|nr:hypothetical protein [Verrucomicrobiota bacterium]
MTTTSPVFRKTRRKLGVFTFFVLGAPGFNSPAWDGQDSGQGSRAWDQVDRLGPPTFHAPPVERYRFGAPDPDNPDYYPIPKGAVTRDTYMRWIELSGMLEYAKQPRLGSGGPTLLLPALAKFVQTGEAWWGEACIAMLKDYHLALQREVQEKGWTEQFAEPPAFLPLYRKHLIAGNLMAPDEPWFRELWLYYCRHLHVWNSVPVEWRGPCHRSMPEALAKGLAAKWYPQIPEAARWKRYSEQVWGDFWRVKDLFQNDTGYFQDATRAYAFASPEWLGDDRFLADPEMQPVWQRLMAELTPDGAINPYGPNGGWNSTAALRVGVLERVASATRNGTYRFAAHKAMNYLNYQLGPTLRDGYLRNQETAPYIVLAWLTADDSLEARTPPAGGLITHRREYARIPHRDKAVVGRFLPNLDPDPDKANLCCNQAFTDRTVTDKLILRSGWNPGDFFVLVDLVPTSFPFNAGGILGMNRWGAPFTQVVTSKGDIPENRLAVADLSGETPRRLIPDPDRISEDWKKGKMPDIWTMVPFFRDTPQAAHARVDIQNPEGLPVRVVQEYVFVKNRYLVRRETVLFEESFPARIQSLWNTQNIGPQIGGHWANTFMTAPVASNGRVNMHAPPADLLVWFGPQPGWRLQVVDRTAEDPRTQVTPGQLRYVWQGTPARGERRHVTQVYYPHAATRSRATSVEPGARSIYDGGLVAATAGAAAIRVIQDSLDVTILRIEFEAGHVEWIAFNPTGQTIEVAGRQTTEPLLYSPGTSP